MAPLIFFTALFICGLINYFFFKPIPPKKPPPAPSKTTEEIKNTDQLQSLFSTFDGDGNGFITSTELEQSLKRLNLPVTPHDVKSMMDKVDANGDGLIDLHEFRGLYESLEAKDEGDGEMEMREAFEVFDGNGDGVITVEELGEVLVSMGLRERGESEEDCKDMIRNVDLDGDGMVNFEEFKKMMMMVKSNGKML